MHSEHNKHLRKKKKPANKSSLLSERCLSELFSSNRYIFVHLSFVDIILFKNIKIIANDESHD